MDTDPAAAGPAGGYRPLRRSEELDVDLRGLRCRVHRWGSGGATRPLLLLHGWADTGLTWQFLVDAFGTDRAVLAPDWRGFGDSAAAPGGYWFPDYLGDLDALLDGLRIDTPVDVVGHSMGGNIATLYCGSRPERIRRVAILEAFGLEPQPPSAAPLRYREWLDQLRDAPRFRDYPSLDALAAYLRRQNPRLTPDRALFVAAAWSRPTGDGRVVLRADPAHKRVNPVLYRHEEFKACMAAIASPVLVVAGELSPMLPRFRAEAAVRSACLRNASETVLPGAGHMLHHDQPAALAALLGAFFDA